MLCPPPPLRNWHGCCLSETGTIIVSTDCQVVSDYGKVRVDAVPTIGSIQYSPPLSPQPLSIDNNNEELIMINGTNSVNNRLSINGSRKEPEH